MKRFLVLVFLPFVLAGCLTSTNPFFANEDVVRDDRLIGTYPDEGDKDVKFVIAASHDREGHYDIRVYDKYAWIAYVGTLFRVGDITFLDLYPSGDSAMRRDPGGPPTITGLLHAFTFQPLHLVIRVLPTTDALTYSTMDRRGLGVLLEREPSLRPHVRGESLLSPQPATDLKKLLQKYGGNDEVFNLKATLKKSK